MTTREEIIHTLCFIGMSLSLYGLVFLYRLEVIAR